MRTPEGTTKTLTRADGSRTTLVANFKPMSDHNDLTECEACGRAFVYGQTATDEQGRKVHWSFDCTDRRNW